MWLATKGVKLDYRALAPLSREPKGRVQLCAFWGVPLGYDSIATTQEPSTSKGWPKTQVTK